MFYPCFTSQSVSCIDFICMLFIYLQTALFCCTAWVRQCSLQSNWVEVIVFVPDCGPVCNKSLLSSPTDNKEVVTD